VLTADIGAEKMSILQKGSSYTLNMFVDSVLAGVNRSSRAAENETESIDDDAAEPVANRLDLYRLGEISLSNSVTFLLCKFLLIRL
jgi:hypothetical protein